jgi:hypothetical protein
MIRSTLFFGMLVAFLFTSCSKDPAENSSSSSLVGSWKVKSIKCDDCKSVTVVGGQSLDLIYKMTGEAIAIKVDINADLTMQSSGAYTAVLEGTLDGSPYYQEVPLSSYNFSGGYERKGDQLTVSNPADGASGVYSISNETASAMTWTTKVSQSNEPQPGITTQMSGTYVFTLEKL